MPAFAIGLYNIRDASWRPAYRQVVDKLVAKHGGRYVARATNSWEVLEGAGAALACQESLSGHIDPRVVSYARVADLVTTVPPVGHRSIAATVLDPGPCRTPRRLCAGAAGRRGSGHHGHGSRHADHARQRPHVR